MISLVDIVDPELWSCNTSLSSFERCLTCALPTQSTSKASTPFCVFFSKRSSSVVNFESQGSCLTASFISSVARSTNPNPSLAAAAIEYIIDNPRPPDVPQLLDEKG